MRTPARYLAIAAALLAGCRSAPPVPPGMPRGSPPPLDLPVGPAPAFSPDPAALPVIDGTRVGAADLAPEPPGYRPLTEDQCRREAAARAPLAALIVPDAADDNCPGLRDLVVLADRNRAAGDALVEFYRLADADGRAAVIRDALPTLDRLRAEVAALKAQGVRLPTDPAELDRQRAALLGVLVQADLGAGVFDVDLKRRVGVPGRPPERLRPAGPFAPVAAPPEDRDALVDAALAARPDLQLLRLAYLRLTPETLPRVRELLDEPVKLAIKPPDPLKPRRGKEPDPEAVAEVAVRRAQLGELIARRERQAADQVRAAAAATAAQVLQVGLAKWKLDQLTTAAAAGPDPGPLARLAAELDIARARADVVAAVTAWHQARVRLLAAQGVLGGP